MNKDALDYLFATGLVKSVERGNDSDIEDNEMIRFQPKYILQSIIRSSESNQELINDYVMFVDSLDLKEEFMTKIETGFDVPFKTLKVLTDIYNVYTPNPRTLTLLNLVFYYTIKDTPGSLDRINEDFDGLLKNTAYKVELYEPKYYTENRYMLTFHAPFKISFDKELIKDRYDDKLLNSEVIYSTFKRRLYRDHRYTTLAFMSIHLSDILIIIEEPLI